MAEAPAGPPATVVDYDAWKRGYTPPSEHNLIDQLAYRGARVVMGCDLASAGAIWVVMRGDLMNGPLRKHVRQMIELTWPDAPPEPYEYETPWC